MPDLVGRIAVPLVGFAAYSGTGKTTLLTRLLGIFISKHLRVGIVKHAHHTFEIDHPGKDSFELRKAGASQVLIGSKKRWALLVENPREDERALEDHIRRLDLDNLDLILVEGFKPEAMPKIELHRPDLGHDLLYPHDESIIAIATDSALSISNTLPVLDLNNAEQIARFIIDRYALNEQTARTAMSTIKKDISCRDDFDPASLSAALALEKIRSAVAAVKGTEKIAIRSALNRILAEDMHSQINVPAGTNSAMDGYAVRSEDIPAKGVATLKIAGTSWAGNPYKGELPPGSCIRIMTGGIMPTGTDTVIIQEDVEVMDDGISIDNGTQKGDNVRQAGEDLAIGDRILARGRRLNPADIGLIASLGVGEVNVMRQLRVAFFSTGDELRSIGEVVTDGNIYDSNRYTLHGMLSKMGAQIIDMGVIKDDRQALEAAFENATDNADVLITSGGVSVGEADYIKDILARLGQVDFWKVAIKPGRPLAFGHVNDTVFFGLPGNPVSVMVTFYEFVQPALRKMSGEDDADMFTLKVRCDSRLKKRPGRVEYQRGVLQKDDAGDLKVVKTGAQGSGILSSMSQANCFIILSMDCEGVEPGSVVDVQPFFGLM